MLAALAGVAVGGLVAGLLWPSWAQGAEESRKKRTRVVYPKKTELDFSGLAIQGEIKNPAEFYFQRRNEEKFGSLVKRRASFQREMLRDAVMNP